jgi:hypothetical protein
MAWTRRPAAHAAAARADRWQDAARLQHRSEWHVLVVGNQNSDTIGTFKIDPAKGTLTATGHTISVGKPVSFEFVR